MAILLPSSLFFERDYTFLEYPTLHGDTRLKSLSKSSPGRRMPTNLLPSFPFPATMGDDPFGLPASAIAAFHCRILPDETERRTNEA
jgi:hypothetical protein